MSSVEQNSPDPVEAQNAGAKTGEISTEDGLKAPPERPKLVAPPPRPVRPVAQPKPAKSPLTSPPPTAPVSTAATVSSRTPSAVATPEPAPAAPVDATPSPRYSPIAPPSEPMQYRAIGLVRGTYEPTEADQLNRGNLTTEDGQVIDSVLLGRVTSLVKKHIDLATVHLWVVYPRTRREMDTDEEQDLHLQIVGVWEPETLGLPGESPVAPDQISEATPDAASEGSPETVDSPVEKAAEDAPAPAGDSPKPMTRPADLPAFDENFFSIRGEIVKYSPEDQLIMVKILQGVKRSPGLPKSFKLMLHGTLEGRTVGYFWDFKVKREAKLLVLQEATVVGIVPPKKRSPGGGSRRAAPGRKPGGSRLPLPSRRPAGVQGSLRPRKPGVEKEPSE
jgi:hypothetical protein